MSEGGKRKGGEAGNRGFGALVSAGRGAFGVRLLLGWMTVSLAVLTVFAGRLAWDPSVSPRELLPLVAFTLAVVIEFAVAGGRTLSTDCRILAIATFLSGLGMAMQFRMGAFAGGSANGATLALPAGFAAMLAVYVVFRGGRWRWLSRLAPLCYVAALGALAAMLVFGRRFRGGLYLPGNVNPTEIVKPLAAVFLAAYFAKRGDSFRRAFLGIPIPGLLSLGALAALWLPVMVLAVAVRDLGLILLLNLILAVMLATSSRRGGWLLLFVLAAVAAGWIAWRMPGHVHARLAAWLDPFADPTGSGWQLLQGFSAMFAGGIWGAGFGAGLPVEVPIVATDFVYAAVAEELGMALCLLVLSLYAALAVRGFMGADRPHDRFGQSLAAGLTAVLSVQALLNLAGIVKALPLTGVVLPFLSHGGSGLVAMMATVGLLAAVESD